MMHKGLVSGSFDPITVGHVEMIERAAKLCDRLDVGVFVNADKSSMFTMDQRVEMIKAAVSHIPNVGIVQCDGHLPRFVLENGYDVMFRGLRNASDFGYEIGLAQIYAKFYNGKAETVYLMTDPNLSYISSSVVRVNFELGADIRDWVPAPVYELMKKYRNI
ncbi:MAG: pantetheine-phosphate adenylyltransferase [Firmicutes bacterium]|nr:pantetheine-phosphate adenylyltransferase [Bacillota bacterium]